MKIVKLTIIVFCLVFDFFSLHAQGMPLLTIDLKTVSNEDLKIGNGPTFSVEKDGLVLIVSFPNTAKDFDALTMILILSNKTSADFNFKAGSGLRGFRFSFKKESGEEVAPTRFHQNQDLTGPPIGFESETIKAGSSMVLGFLLKNDIPITEPGKYAFKVNWRDLKMGMVGWAPDKESKIEVNGSILIQQTSNGISISAAK